MCPIMLAIMDSGKVTCVHMHSYLYLYTLGEEELEELEEELEELEELEEEEFEDELGEGDSLCCRAP